MRKLWIIAAREYSERVTKPPFLISTGLMLVLLLGSVLAPLLFGGGGIAPPSTVLVYDTEGAIMAQLEAQLAAADSGGRLSLQRIGASDVQDAERRAKKGQVAGLLVLSGQFPDAIKADFKSGSLIGLERRGVVALALTHAAQAERARRSGLATSQLQYVLAPVDVRAVNLASGESGGDRAAFRFALAMAASGLVYVGVVGSGALIFQGVLEEKTSRVVEVLAASVRPVEMLGGKILGLGLLGLTQYASWLLAWFFLLTVGYATIGPDVSLATPAFMAYLLLFTVLGYFMYGSMFAAAGSLISRIEDSASVMMPILLPLMLPMLAAGYLNQNPEGSLARTLSFIPLFSPSVMLTRIVLSRVPMWEIATTLLITVATTLVVVWLAGRVYRVGVLTYGARPSLRQIWRYLNS